ncbi:MAG: hypothetical protein M3294_07700 [Pseudomonadota bacterium]|nr:hypothetical protein [Pseudomonadota bacterium]
MNCPAQIGRLTPAALIWALAASSAAVLAPMDELLSAVCLIFMVFFLERMTEQGLEQYLLQHA